MPPRTAASQPAGYHLDRHLLALSGLTDVIWLEGIDDLGGGHTTDAIIAGYQDVVKRLHGSPPAPAEQGRWTFPPQAIEPVSMARTRVFRHVDLALTPAGWNWGAQRGRSFDFVHYTGETDLDTMDKSTAVHVK